MKTPAKRQAATPKKAAARQQPAKNTMHELKITLCDIKPAIWRRLLVRSDMNLGLLHAVIQIAMGWTNSHLHQFHVGEQGYTDLSIRDEGPLFPGEERDRDEDKTTLAQVAPNPKDRFVYEYDFGDSWEHLVTVEKVLEPAEPPAHAATCLAGARACPPDDCGGAWGYQNLLEALKDPEHEEHEDLMEWVGEGFDPEAFDVEKTNHYLAQLRWPRTSMEQLARVLMARDDYRG